MKKLYVKLKSRKIWKSDTDRDILLGAYMYISPSAAIPVLQTYMDRINSKYGSGDKKDLHIIKLKQNDSYSEHSLYIKISGERKLLDILTRCLYLKNEINDNFDIEVT